MISDLDINPLDLTEAHILNDDFNHDKLFKYLKDIDYYNRIWFSIIGEWFYPNRLYILKIPIYTNKDSERGFGVKENILLQ